MNRKPSLTLATHPEDQLPSPWIRIRRQAEFVRCGMVAFLLDPAVLAIFMARVQLLVGTRLIALRRRLSGRRIAVALPLRTIPSPDELDGPGRP
jgi:hypothetical protein